MKRAYTVTQKVIESNRKKAEIVKIHGWSLKRAFEVADGRFK